MAEFQYKGKDARGQMKSGVIKAANKAQAKATVGRMRLKSVSIAEVKGGAPAAGSVPPDNRGFFYKDKNGKLQIRLGEPQPNTKDIIIFSKQFATMISSGVPLIQALGILAQQQRVYIFGRAIEIIQNTVENGATLSEALTAYPRYFDSLYISMVRAGEASGSLDTIMTRLVTYIEKSAKIKAQVKSAMMYPIIVTVVAIAVVSALLLFVVPTFAKQFQDAGKELPGLTQMVVDLSNFMAEYWYIIFGGIAAAAYLFRAYIRTEKGREWFDRWILKAPGIGMLLNKVAVGRFCSTMATMLSCGVNMLEALTICASSSGNKTIEAFVINVRSKIEQGSKFSEPLGEGTLFPGMVVSMVAVGEATGALDDMLVKISEFYEEEVDLAVKTVLSMIEPIMIVVIGSIVGTIVIAMYLPVFDMASVVGG